MRVHPSVPCGTSIFALRPAVTRKSDRLIRGNPGFFEKDIGKKYGRSALNGVSLFKHETALRFRVAFGFVDEQGRRSTKWENLPAPRDKFPDMNRTTLKPYPSNPGVPGQKDLKPKDKRTRDRSLWTPASVKLVLPPRQSRGIPLRIRNAPSCYGLHIVFKFFTHILEFFFIILHFALVT